MLKKRKVACNLTSPNLTCFFYSDKAILHKGEKNPFQVDKTWTADAPKNIYFLRTFANDVSICIKVKPLLHTLARRVFHSVLRVTQTGDQGTLHDSG